MFGKRRDENDWYAAASGDQAILKVKAAHARHLYVGDQAGAVIDPRRAQEILCGFEHESDETERPQKLCIATRTDAPSSTIETI